MVPCPPSAPPGQHASPAASQLGAVASVAAASAGEPLDEPVDPACPVLAPDDPVEPAPPLDEPVDPVLLAPAVDPDPVPVAPVLEDPVLPPVSPDAMPVLPPAVVPQPDAMTASGRIAASHVPPLARRHAVEIGRIRFMVIPTSARCVPVPANGRFPFCHGSLCKGPPHRP